MLSGFELFPRWVPLKKVMYVFMVTSKTGAVSNILKKNHESLVICYSVEMLFYCNTHWSLSSSHLPLCLLQIVITITVTTTHYHPQIIVLKVIIVTGGCFQKEILRLLGCYDS